MLQPSQRGVALPASPYRKLTPFADAARQRGIIVHPLNIGQPDIETPPSMLAAVQRASIQVLEYSPTAGYPSYRRKLADYYQRLGLDVVSDDIIVTTGGSEAIAFALLACLNPGDEFIVPEPFYGPYSAFAVATGTHVVPVTARLEDNFALPPLAEFERKITPRTKAILICSPNNPTGYVYSRAELEQLKELCLRHNLYLLSDEAYREFCYNTEYTSALNLRGADDHIVLLDTISKRYSACGARIGAIVTKNPALRDVFFKLAQLRVSPPGLGQLLAEAAADLPATYFDHTKTEYLARRDLMLRRLRAMPGVQVPTPSGAFYVIAHLPVDDADRFAQWLLEEFSYHGQTLMISPASGFYATPGLGRQQVRLAYVVNQDIISKAMDCLEAALQQYPGREEQQRVAAGVREAAG
ncbi:pyridoxal phosphate-dependent aminotransferase [Microvirga sp. STR05]|uniref:Pyridoxal phosphate-dependent aminotransferase n=1 Tax=Hymenobacter duratus TaxID=2771356 RepID=A0ABR8JGB4_9BACT|nr:pyridoxal phosphate-dependent aminotransferase [Hymenobacter duratus]MBD2715913.1 pyridoxal phosphate-dependent aminotransferase [Hymenobacter duratus]MBR7950827.1 pyridoxal phosphate-dependent aminotransferase [Microvirga sp. STR05]